MLNLATITRNTHMKKILLIALLSVMLASCNHKPKADLIIYNATIYTVDPNFSTVGSIVIKDGKIIETGIQEEMLSKYDATDTLDLSGKFIYPGFIDAHAHFVGYAGNLQRVNLVDTKSWDDVIDRTKQFAVEHSIGWLTGRGWDQNDWDIKEFPSNEKVISDFNTSLMSS